MVEEEAEPSALAHVGRTLNDELDTACVREREKKQRKGVCEREPRKKGKRKGEVRLQPHERLPISISSFSSSIK